MWRVGSCSLVLLAVLLALGEINAAGVGCPYHTIGSNARITTESSKRSASLSISSTAAQPYDQAAVMALDLDAVKADLRRLMNRSKEWWPSDWGHYGPLFIRLAWHCAGTYRTSDGRGGCDGARQRFEPERSWDDNTNLDKARALLWQLKKKYGAALSWGDLIVLAGDTAIESMGGRTLGFCGGRLDDSDGSASLKLGPGAEQQAVAPCPVQGDCKSPLGSTTIGLIYVNPEGPMGEPDPQRSAPQIRDVFGRMGMDDAETVALIGGGHAFGKAHGACPGGPGPSPAQQPDDPWPGSCGEGAARGRGPNTFTSGFEGPWTTTPTQWDNQYFRNLLGYGWAKRKSPGGHWQWAPTPLNGESPSRLPAIMMLTTDVALLHDTQYRKLVQLYAANQSALEGAFAAAWYKLVTRDMGPPSRCLGSKVPPAQPFQSPLQPRAPGPAPDWDVVRRDVLVALRKESPAAPPDRDGRGLPWYGALLATLAWQCASTFRSTDYTGGCNGARIRLSPQRDWPANAGMGGVIKLLEPIVARHPGLSYADLIVLAGGFALQQAGARHVDAHFCPGRVDADAPASNLQPPRELPDKIAQWWDDMEILGLEPREYVALQGRLRSPSHQRALGYSGSWAEDSSMIANDDGVAYFNVLLSNRWTKATSASGLAEYVAVGSAGVFLTPYDMVLLWDPQLRAIAEEYASNPAPFNDAFAAGWTRLMNADRFKGPTGNECY